MHATVVELEQRDVFDLDMLRSLGLSTEGALRIAAAARPWGQTARWVPPEDEQTSAGSPQVL
jgi:hypothetical protein